MRYFTYIAEQAFKTSESGERLFYRGGPWSHPFIIPDDATEQRLYRKQVGYLRWTFGPLIFGQPFLFVALTPKIFQPSWFFSYLVTVVFVIGLVGQLVFRREVKTLQRAPTRLSIHSFFGQKAQKHSRTQLVLGLLMCLLLVAANGWVLSLPARHLAGFSHLLIAACTVFFCLLSVLWGYVLYLKLTDQTHGAG